MSLSSGVIERNVSLSGDMIELEVPLSRDVIESGVSVSLYTVIELGLSLNLESH